MPADLRISLVQSFLHWEDISANLRNLEKKLSALSQQTDLVILPEMFTTGFSMNVSELAENMKGATVAWMKRQAKELNAVVMGSFIAVENGLYFNRLVWMTPQGEYKIYNKRHLFTLAGEQNHYEAGQSLLITEWKGWRICPLICYDLRFPVWSRNTDNYDLLIYVANFPARRRRAWQSLLIARAIENQSYVAGVNRIGTDGKGVYYSGDSQLVDYDGRLIHHCADEESVLTAALSYNHLQQYRQKYAFLADRDQFSIIRSD